MQTLVVLGTWIKKAVHNIIWLHPDYGAELKGAHMGVAVLVQIAERIFIYESKEGPKTI